MKSYDLVVIGGGINGCGCAAEAASRGLSVALIEKNDLASETSSQSSKLIHGGLRYLEQYDFKLVKHALDEREILCQIAPHLIHPLPFILPLLKSDKRPAWLIQSSLFLYDHLSVKNTFPRHKRVKRIQRPSFFDTLHDNIGQGFLFHDAQTEDTRLVIHNALQAHAQGADIFTYTQLLEAKTYDNTWQLTLKNEQKNIFHIQAKVFINAAGSAVSEVNHLCGVQNNRTLLYVQGSHLVVPKLYEGAHAYLLQDEEERIIFTIPYHDAYTLIGTTETPLSNPQLAKITPEETAYLIKTIAKYFKVSLSPDHIISTFCGVRTLVNHHQNAHATSRDYAYDIQRFPAPSVSILSGKITTYRQLAECIINQFSHTFPEMLPSKTAQTPLIGATWEGLNFSAYQEYFHTQYAFLDATLRARYLKTYGTRSEMILSGVTNMQDLGKDYGHMLYQAEIDYLKQYEWAKTEADILWRRTKLGLSEMSRKSTNQ